MAGCCYAGKGSLVVIQQSKVIGDGRIFIKMSVSLTSRPLLVCFERLFEVADGHRVIVMCRSLSSLFGVIARFISLP